MRNAGKDRVQWAAGAFLLIVLFVCLSHIYPAGLGMSGEPGSGQYDLISEQDGTTRQIQGPVYYEMSGNTSSILQDRVFKLHFIHPKMDSGNGFGFLIPLGEEAPGIREDRYRIQRTNAYPQMPSVFGYADILNEGAGLYFTEAGSISILEVGPSEIQGEMNMIMKNANGREMKVKGRFSASPLTEDTAF